MTGQIQVPYAHHVMNAAMYIAMRITLKLDLQGLENVPRTGPCIVVINHTNFLDPLIPGVFLRRDVLPMAKAEFFSGWWRWMFQGYGAFPVRRGEMDLAAVKHALTILKHGHMLLISPEGTRTKSGTLEEAREGVALIALRSGAPLLPVAMWGGIKFKDNLPRLRRTPVSMRVGEALMIRALERKPGREELRAITDELMYTIAAMLPPEYRGVYAEFAGRPTRFLVRWQPHGNQGTAGRPKEVMPLMN